MKAETILMKTTFVQNNMKLKIERIINGEFQL